MPLHAYAPSAPLVKTPGSQIANGLAPKQPKPHLALRPQLTSEGCSKGEEHTQEDVPGHGSIVVNYLTLGDGEDDPKYLEKHKEDWKRGPCQLAHGET